MDLLHPRYRPLPQLAQLVRMVLALRETLYDQIADLDGQLIRQARASPKLTNHFPSAEVEEVTPAS
jgi:hypothetical protein